jgi:hypothetical protein
MKLYCKREWEAEVPDEMIVKAVDKYVYKNFYRPYYSLMNRKDVQSLAEYIVETITGYDKYPNEFTKPLRTRIREIIAQRIKEREENADD